MGTEWAVEVTWVDAKKAGAQGPTSQYGPFETEAHRDKFLTEMRRDRAISATRVLTREASYTPWEPTGEASPISDEERDALLMALWREVNTPAAPASADDRRDEAGGGVS